jgi:eukaryotic-like serine/threonine-protein kinase
MSARETIGPYRLLAEISSGGMGIVYLARDERMPGFEKLVALKRIHTHLADDERFIAMFLDEARIASLVRHANVCGVEDFGSEDGTSYLTMEFLVGEPLSKVVREMSKRADLRGPRFFAIAARLLSDACEGLHAAHELTDARGMPLELVHRDISLPNLFVGYDGVIRILDFGVAKAAHRIAETTVDGVKGKFAYMAPEQLRRGAIDRRADVWSLGVVAWEILTCERLFRRDGELDTIEAVMNGPIPLASEIAPDVPAELDAVVQRALTRDLDARYGSAREMGRDLAAYLADCGSSAGLADAAEFMSALFPNGRAEKLSFVELALAGVARTPRPGAEERTVREPERRRAPYFAIAIAIVLGIGIGGSLLAWGNDEEPVAREEAEVHTPIENEPPPSAPAPAIATSAAMTAEDAPATRVETPPRAPARRARANGTLQLATRNGWARVRAGGRDLGTTPLRTALAAGRHSLELIDERGRSRRVRVEVRAGETTRVSIDLDR